MSQGWFAARAVSEGGGFPRRRTLLWNMVVSVLAIAGICLVETFTDADIDFQRWLFDDTTGTWLVSRELHAQLKQIAYNAPKSALVVFGAYWSLGLLRSVRNPAWRARRKGCVLMLLALIVVPCILAGSRSFTNMYCPSQLVEFGGEYELQRILEPANPANSGPGRLAGMCFPAGHASGGFALMMLYFARRPGQTSRGGLLFGLGYGLAMGLYQVIRGEHFMSDTLVTMVGAWGIVCGLVLLTDWVWAWPWHRLVRRFRLQQQA